MSERGIVKFKFYGDELDVVPMPEGDVGVVLKRLCEAIPVDIDGQVQRLERLAAAGVKWATTCLMQVVAEDGKTRVMHVLPRQSIPMWAATIDVARLPKQARQEVHRKLVTYQDQCAEALADHFLGPRRAPEDVAELLGRVSAAEAETAVLRAKLELLSETSPGVIGEAQARRFILDPIREAARIYCATIGDFTEATFRREFKDRENQVRLHVAFPAALGQRWQHLPIAKFGDAVAKGLEILERERRRRKDFIRHLSKQLALPAH